MSTFTTAKRFIDKLQKTSIDSMYNETIATLLNQRCSISVKDEIEIRNYIQMILNS